MEVKYFIGMAHKVELYISYVFDMFILFYKNKHKINIIFLWNFSFKIQTEIQLDIDSIQILYTIK